MSEWISIKDKLPDKKQECLVTFHPCYWNSVLEDRTYVGLDTFRGKESWAKHKYQRVTHWMPLPEPAED